MIKEFVVKQLIKYKLGNLPKEVQERLAGAIEKEPAFFEALSKEIDALSKQGKSQTAAAMIVMRKHQQKLREILS